jgi:hypothetical protein
VVCGLRGRAAPRAAAQQQQHARPTDSEERHVGELDAVEDTAEQHRTDEAAGEETRERTAEAGAWSGRSLRRGGRRLGRWPWRGLALDRIALLAEALPATEAFRRIGVVRTETQADQRREGKH